MRAVVQRVAGAVLTVEGCEVSRIDKGLCVYLGVGAGDSEREADVLAGKLARLRIFSDDAGKMNLSVLDAGGEVMVISQFTLFADVSHGNRPGFSAAEKPERAKQLYEYFGQRLEAEGIRTVYGVFGADMTISQQNTGPVTIIMEAIDGKIL